MTRKYVPAVVAAGTLAGTPVRAQQTFRLWPETPGQTKIAILDISHENEHIAAFHSRIMSSYILPKGITMQRRTRFISPAISLALISFIVQSQDTKDSPAYPAKGFRLEFLRGYDDLEKKFLTLAEAFPQEKYAWRPGEGVRSVGEVIGHVAAGNYGYAVWLGVQPPQDVDRPGLERMSEKPKLIEALKSSFDHYRRAVLRIPEEDLERPVKMQNRPGTVREALLFVAAHQPEHLGQLIAYARMNGVVPPWTAERQQQPMKK